MCPHCQSEVAEGAKFCAMCGRAVESRPGGSGRPRLVTEDEDLSPVGRVLRAEMYGEQAKTHAVGGLVACAAMMLLSMLVLMMVGPNVMAQMRRQGAIKSSGSPAGMAVLGILVFAYVVLAAWARKRPLPAALVGMIMLSTLLLAGAVIDPRMIAGCVLLIAALSVLVLGVNAGLKQRSLQDEGVAGSGLSKDAFREEASPQDASPEEDEPADKRMGDQGVEVEIGGARG